MEFHIAREVRERLDLSEVLFSYTGNVVFANVAASRKLAQRLTELRGGEAAGPKAVVNAGALFAMGLIDELSHAMVARYRRDVDPAVLTEALRWLEAKVGSREKVDKLLLAFTEQFPNVEVYSGRKTAAEWLKGTTEGLPNREAAMEEMLLLWLANSNPAFAPFKELFDDTGLKEKTAYKEATPTLPAYFATRPRVEDAGTLLEALQAPMMASPESLSGQLEFIREKWPKYLGDDLRRVLLAVDVLREEEIAIWMRFNPAGPERFAHGAPVWGNQGFVGDEYVGFDDEWMIGPGGRRVRRYSADHQAPLNEYEAFSADYAWMPNVVLMAKSTYVWLEQLSKKHGRHIHRLDQIPDDELRLLANRGITALWLIGLWERSVASKTIKRLRGHHDAVASAYSLKEYEIAEDLGGNHAYEVLRDRAMRAGLRLASDMVPNHMGIDSKWVIEHPDWFISRWESPFPSYSFNGPDLSTDSRVEIKIEDHYFDQTDAAVVFRLRHQASGETRYTYHGNDGTTFAWNDTAQLDYSKAYVREQVIQTILHVARLFPIIRFDAAMTLAKRHVQRLWFPLPGVGGSIPSRAESAMSQEEFDALMPHEFWREVVDRVGAEVPGTLLLAEAFWLLEGYFVRTLGMHRVYNSAFMNMLRDEENAKYRSYLKKTIEFDPDIMKRYVNFMSNPDERTAIDQFGTGDKFFGVSTLLATLPGLPMFGHGQIEGYTERYGMEFKQAKMNEWPNDWLVERHQREIAPLLKDRWQFAESANFVLYDYWTGNGTVDENVFAYSNRWGDARSIVLYNNRYESTHGTIHVSAASMDKGSGELRQRRIHEGLDLSTEWDTVIAFRDATTHLEYLRRGSDIAHNGLTMGLRGYQYVVLRNWRQLRSTAEYPWGELCDALHGAGVHNVDEALTKLRLRSLHEALRDAVSPAQVAAAQSAADGAVLPVAGVKPSKADPEKTVEASSGEKGEAVGKIAAEKKAKGEAVLPAEDSATGHDEDVPEVAVPESMRGFVEACDRLCHRASEQARDALKCSGGDKSERALSKCKVMSVAAVALPALSMRFSSDWPKCTATMLPVQNGHPTTAVTWGAVLAWVALQSLPVVGDRVRLMDELQLRSAMAEAFSWLGAEGEDAWRWAARVRLLLAYHAEADPFASKSFWAEGDVRWLASVSESDGVTYVNKEAAEELLAWVQLPKLLEAAGDPAKLKEVEAGVLRHCRALEESGYRLTAMLEWDGEDESEATSDAKGTQNSAVKRKG